MRTRFVHSHEYQEGWLHRWVDTCTMDCSPDLGFVVTETGCDDGGDSVNVEVSVAWFHHLTTDVETNNCGVETVGS